MEESNSALDEIMSHLSDLVRPEKVVVRTRRNPGGDIGHIKGADDEPDEPDALENEQQTSLNDDAAFTGPQPERRNLSSATTDANFFCDHCDAPITGIRMKCQDCPNFDYCAGCFTDAKLIHPGHTFMPMQGREPAPAGKYDLSVRADFHAMKGMILPLLHRACDEASPAHPCKSCGTLAETFAMWHHLINDGPDEVQREGRLAYIQRQESQREWTVRVTSLAEATALGCAFCSYFLKKMFGPHSGVGFSYRAQMPWFLQHRAESEDRVKVITRAMELSTKLKNDRFVFRIAPIVRQQYEKGDPWLFKVVLTCVGAHCGQDLLKECFGIRGVIAIELLAFSAKNSIAKLCAPEAPNPASASTESLTRAHSWLKSCEERHGLSCSVGRATPPTRVIDVSDDLVYRIVESIGESARYCALSYQWGGPQEFHLSTKNFSTLRDGFPTTDLPRTIADAAKVARNLNIRYLWVDALCILQDSSSDKIHEISHMEEIYKHATITIVAANSSSVNTGFLNEVKDDEPRFWRSLVPVRYPIINRPQTSPENETNKTNESIEREARWTELLFMDDMEAMDYNVTKDPVTYRSWCLQERLISPRVLNFGRWTTFRCIKGEETDGGYYIGSDPRINKADEFARLLATTSRKTPARPLDHFMLDKILRTWYGIVIDYTNRQLSDPLDRLPAITGIAKIISQATGMQNLAGLWRQNLLHDLLWYADTREFLVRPSIQRAPTWSWASIDYAVSYGHIDSDATPMAEILDCSVRSTGPGLITGSVQIKGKLRAVSADMVLKLFKSQDMRPAVAKKATLVDFYRQMMEQVEDDKYQKQFSQDQVKENLPQNMFAIAMFEHNKRVLDGQSQDGPFYSGLLLTHMGQDSFERFGSFKQDRLPWLDAMKVSDWKNDNVIVH